MFRLIIYNQIKTVLMKNILVVLFTIILFSCSSENENNNDSESFDPIIGTWTELGQGTVSDEGTKQFSEYDYFCATLGRFSFEEDGSYRIETYSESNGIAGDENCTSTGILIGTWENNGEYYLLIIESDSSNDPESGQAEIKIEFPDENQMEWIFDSESDGIDYTYELYEKVE